MANIYKSSRVCSPRGDIYEFVQGGPFLNSRKIAIQFRARIHSAKGFRVGNVAEELKGGSFSEPDVLISDIGISQGELDRKSPEERREFLRLKLANLMTSADFGRLENLRCGKANKR